MHLRALLLSLLLSSVASAVSWYSLMYRAASGAHFTRFSGVMTIPAIPRPGTYYLWPGLQPQSNDGVYQNVLDGRKGNWYLASGWCCEKPKLPWGDGFAVEAGDMSTFDNALVDKDTWTSTITHQRTQTTVASAFVLENKTFTQAIFAIELYGVAWDFGPLQFGNISIVAEGSSDSNWCTRMPGNLYAATNFTVTGAHAAVNGTTVTCTIQSVVLNSPAARHTAVARRGRRMKAAGPGGIQA